MLVTLVATKTTMKSVILLTLLGFNFTSRTYAEELCSSSSSTTVDAEGGIGMVGKNISCNSAATTASAIKSTHDVCQMKVQNGECNSNQDFMFEQCASECIQGPSGELGAIGYFSVAKNRTASYDSGTDTGESTLSNRFGKTSETNEECSDISDVGDCYDWAESGDCYDHSDFMLQNCAKTCMACFSADTKTFEIGVAQEIPSDYQDDSFAIQSILEIISETATYMEHFLTTSIKYDDEELIPLRYDCKNRDSHCAALAAEGYCEEDEEEFVDEDDDESWQNYMMNNCAPACQTCESLAYQFELLKCTADRSTDIFEPNELDDMFLRLVGEIPFDEDVIVPNFTPRIHSRPSPSLFTEKRNSDVNADYITDGPWIVTLDNFLTDEECDRLIELGATEGYERSYLAEDEDWDEEELKKEYETDDAWRTSSNSWCQNECYEDPVAQRVIGKIANTTGVPDAYSEYLQLLKYVPGQYYKVHHDFVENSEYFPSGPRVLTFFLYLNDVEEGGATRFPDVYGDNSGMSVDVYPKRGTALVWPSVQSHNPNNGVREDRTYHEALTVVKGLKYGANAWLHLRDTKNDNCDHDLLYELLGIEEEENDYEEEGFD